MSREADLNNHESHYLHYEAAVAVIVIEILEGCFDDDFICFIRLLWKTLLLENAAQHKLNPYVGAHRCADQSTLYGLKC